MWSARQRTGQGGARLSSCRGHGTGKTTLFQDIVERASWDDPVLRIGPQIRLGYYAQEHDTLDASRTILDELRHFAGLSKDRAFTVLSKFLFSWEDMDKQIATLSGGEKSRVQMAKLMVSGANFLLLDEPTNHLDIASREQDAPLIEDIEGLEEQKLQTERDLAVAYRDRDFKRGDRLTKSLRRVEAEIDGLYAAWEENP